MLFSNKGKVDLMLTGNKKFQKETKRLFSNPVVDQCLVEIYHGAKKKTEIYSSDDRVAQICEILWEVSCLNQKTAKEMQKILEDKLKAQGIIF